VAVALALVEVLALALVLVVAQVLVEVLALALETGGAAAKQAWLVVTLKSCASKQESAGE
jgi:hypothetical protein